jgi:transcription antitermination factor NusG
MDWYAVRTAPNHEAAVNKKVKGYGLTTFYPRSRCRKFTHRKEVRWIERPHFPTYLFVKA